MSKVPIQSIQRTDDFWAYNGKVESIWILGQWSAPIIFIVVADALEWIVKA